MEGVLEWVRTVVFYLILVSAIMHVLPDKQYTKYVQLFVGLLLILITMEPVIHFLNQDNLLDIVYQKAVYLQEHESQQEMVEKLNEEEQQAIMAAYKKQLCVHLKDWFSQKGYQVQDIKVELEAKGVKGIEAELLRREEEAIKKVSLEDRQRDIRELKKMLAEIYEISIGQISLKVR